VQRVVAQKGAAAREAAASRLASPVEAHRPVRAARPRFSACAVRRARFSSPHRRNHCSPGTRATEDSAQPCRIAARSRHRPGQVLGWPPPGLDPTISSRPVFETFLTSLLSPPGRPGCKEKTLTTCQNHRRALRHPLRPCAFAVKMAFQSSRNVFCNVCVVCYKQSGMPSVTGVRPGGHRGLPDGPIVVSGL
jgi:hypothetical protein